MIINLNDWFIGELRSKKHIKAELDEVIALHEFREIINGYEYDFLLKSKLIDSCIYISEESFVDAINYRYEDLEYNVEKLSKLLEALLSTLKSKVGKFALVIVGQDNFSIIDLNK